MKKRSPPDAPEKNAVAWHPAFRDAIRLALLPYSHALSFEFEHALNAEPLRMDALIIKKEPGTTMNAPVGAIFKRANIVEYKSPGDYLSARDYLKAGAYARLYCALEKGAEAADTTLSFMADSRPRKMLKHLREALGYRVREAWPGIYYVEGDIFAVQIIESKRLRDEDGGIWLKSLRRGLNGARIWEIMELGRKLPEGAPFGAYFDVLFRANARGFKEAMPMSDLTIEEVLEEAGFTARWEARGLEKGREAGREEAVKRLQKYGMEPGQIAEALELPLGTVFRYLNTDDPLLK
jgi:hypothetical protein